jgi:hypothetical protein
MKTIRLGILTTLAFSAALGAASAETLQRPQQLATANALTVRLYAAVDCMQRDGGDPTGCSGLAREAGPYASIRSWR